MVNKNKTMKVVFTLKSGKSIVVTMFQDVCFTIYNQWVNNPMDEQSKTNKIAIDKKKDNMVVELVSILLSEIVAIQIEDKNYFCNKTE